MDLKGRLKVGAIILGVIWAGNFGYNVIRTYTDSKVLKCSEVSKDVFEYLREYSILDNLNNRKWLNEDGKKKLAEVRDQLLPRGNELLRQCMNKEDTIINNRMNRAFFFGDFNFPFKIHETTVTYYE